MLVQAEAGMSERPPGVPSQVFALERYLHWADVMRQHFKSQDYDDERRAHWEPYMAAWYGMLNTVVEGWTELGFSDPEIDELLRDEEMKKLLKRYRHGAFHYQADYFDDRFLALWTRDYEARWWIEQLHDAFSRWIPDWNQSYGRWLDSKNKTGGQSG